VKFQTFSADELVTPNAPTAAHQKRSQMDNQYELLKSQELTIDQFDELKRYCDMKNIQFLSTPYDTISVKLLEDIGVSQYKIASAEIVNKPLLEAIASTSKPVILATGMSTLEEIKRAISLFRKEHVTLLHCTSSYPPPYEQINMNVLHTLKETFHLPIGYSDHTSGFEIAVMAVSMGASMIEKHFTLDTTMIGPDHFASLDPTGFQHMVSAIRHVEQALGSSKKQPTSDEQESLQFMRRSIHAVQTIEKGDEITWDKVKILRPNDGISPWDIDAIIGKKTTKTIKQYQPVTWDDL
jgi:sialic acid synthase SpsE